MATATATVNLQGILAPLTTPFAADGSIALDRLRDNIVRYNRTALAGYVMTGSTGESVLLSADEIDRIWIAAREAAAPGRILIAGTGVESTELTIARTRRAAEIGYHAALVKTPHYFKAMMTPAALVGYYLRVADASPIPVLLYSVPQYTGISLSADVVVRLAAHPNIVGIKESSGNAQLMAEIVQGAPAKSQTKFQVMVGAASTLLAALSVGVTGGILAVSCFLPETTVEIYEAARANDPERALALQRGILSASRRIVGELGPAGVKAAMDQAGYFGGPPRPPLLPLTPEQRKVVETEMAAVQAPASPAGSHSR